MQKPGPVYKSNRKRRKISTIHGQGFKKSILEVRVISPTGKSKLVAWSEDPHPSHDKRVRKKSDWLTLWSRTYQGEVLQLRINTRTDQLGYRFWGHAHNVYFPLLSEDVKAFSEIMHYALETSNKLEGQNPGILKYRWLAQKISQRRKYLYSRMYPGKRGST